ncbi:uncharacterized protein LOC112187905 isoform X1 [Rosa chinensis]|uniref:uncharacterized protein LOC112187905 isoform X1 n=1 Tax=Rosa chinensis TaxID=74649 RepID=UPI001AD90B28|nr:uncharacterized protein LOC112187905 isoform X1 [Rosa chinensis]
MYGIQRRRIFSKEKLPRNIVQDVDELLGMMVEDHKRLQPNVKTYATSVLGVLRQTQIPQRARILSRKYQTLVSSRVEPLQEEAELGHEIDYMARYIAEGGLTGERKRWVPRRGKTSQKHVVVAGSNCTVYLQKYVVVAGSNCFFFLIHPQVLPLMLVALRTH